ncbi:hypothetical protein ACFUN8_09050 [Streptomyces sp. NPDC057307]
MILSVSYGRAWHYAQSWDEMSRLVAAVLAGLAPESRTGQWYAPGEDAWF